VRSSAGGASGQLRVGAVSFSFQRIGADLAPTPSRGAIPVLRASRFPRARALGWPRAAFVVHVPEGEAMWIGLAASTAGPTALRVRFDGLDGLTGLPWQAAVSTAPQNYAVWPLQLWIEGAYRDGRLHARFSLAEARWRVLELSLIRPRSPIARARPPRARPLVSHDPTGGEGEAPEPGSLVPDRTGIRWADAPEATVSVYVASPSTYTDVTGLPPLPAIAERDTYRGWRLP
jgi:hypothetical protein